MKSRYFPYKHLTAALLCFAVAALLNLGAFLLHPMVTHSEKEVQDNVHLALRKAVRDMNRVKPYLADDTINFHDLLHDKTYYPTFIYKGEQMVFWTDHTQVADPVSESLIQKPQVIENRFGKFLVWGNTYHKYRIVVYIPLERQYSINNKYLAPSLNEDIFKSQRYNVILDPASKFTPIKYQGRYLFSVEPLQENTARTISHTAIALISLGLIFLIWSLIRVSQGILREGKYLHATLILLIPLLGIRLVLIYYNFPFSVLEIEAFDPKLYAASVIAPSIGDLLLNALLLLVFTIHINQVVRGKIVNLLLQKLTHKGKLLVVLGCAIYFYLLLLGLYFIYYTSFTNSSLIMDITESLEFSVYKILLYTAFIIHTIIFLIYAHLIMQIFHYLHFEIKNKFYWYLVLALTGLIFILSGGLANQEYLVLLGISLLFYLAVLFSRFKKNISPNPFHNYLFIFWIIAVSSLTGSLAIYQHYLRQISEYKKSFIADLLEERDLQGEYLLGDIAKKIQHDRIIRSKITNPFTNKDFIEQKITKYYLKSDFEKYETTVKLFDHNDVMVDASGGTYKWSDYQRNYLTNALRTEQPGLFLIKAGVQPYSRKYIMYFRVLGEDNYLVTVVLELNLKKLMPNSVIPELLVDKKHLQPLYSRGLSYAIYQKNARTYSEGNYDYVHFINRKTLQNSNLYEAGIRADGFHHFGIKSNNDKIIIVSSAQYSIWDVASNFSLFFLLHTFVFLIYMFSFLFLQGGVKKALDTNFSTKIQLFLNFGVLVPLLVVSVATASMVTNSYKKDLQSTYEIRGRMVQQRILNSWVWAAYKSNKEALREEVSEIANLSEADINLYDYTGKLINSSQPLIFEAGLVSKFMNPEAFADIKENNAQRRFLKEQTGNITFNALYLPLPSIHKKGAFDGFIGIPFYDSEKELELKLIQLLTTIINIFTAMFLAFIVLTNWASRTLTVPLKLVTQKLKQTTLTGKNEKLEYQSADEIGLLVDEYNQMLLKLEESKNELAIREKEAAWREMARQVAHEIKNPLTPMKLSLQYLQKAIAEKKENTEALISKIAQTLITQIEILSDIATSFSNFTALPDLKPERLNIAALLKQSLDLHQNPGEICLKAEIPEGVFEVMADENILMRSFNNLMINAIQAVPTERKPEIKVALRTQDQKVLISFQDNGSGIPEEIRHKIFVPNFSTKFTGSGIGLAVVKKGIESANGRIWFETEEGQGTTFYIEFPLMQE